MKRKIGLIIIMALIIGLASPIYGVNNDIKVTVDGHELDFDVPPQIIEGRTLVPLREIFEALGSAVQWDAKTKTATGQRGSTVVKLPVGSKEALRNGQKIELDVPATIINGRTLVPARFIAESLGAEVAWDGATRTVIINDMGMGAIEHVKDEMIYAHGSTGSYTGYTQNGHPHGKGVFKYPSGNQHKAKEYDGEYKWGKLYGEGTLTYIDGGKYVGEFKDNERSGLGVMTYKDGSEYDGEWSKDQMSGSGMMIYASGDIYVGAWEADKANGEGTMTYANGDKYFGLWKDNKREGQGTMTYENGDEYVGEWKGGYKEGTGTMTYANGEEYEGNWKIDQKHGTGSFTESNGESYRGTWQNDKLIDKHIN